MCRMVDKAYGGACSYELLLLLLMLWMLFEFEYELRLAANTGQILNL